VLKQVVERGEEATTSPEGLSYPKAKRRPERRWTWRSAIVSQRRTYQSRRKGHRCKATNSRAMGWQRYGTAKARLLRSHRSLTLMEGESWSYKGPRRWIMERQTPPREGGRAEAKELHKTGVDGLLIKIAESEGLRVDQEYSTKKEIGSTYCCTFSTQRSRQ
ncbi:hypothetical protein BHM03_00037998, partial [Ensete ventricosum]